MDNNGLRDVSEQIKELRGYQRDMVVAQTSLTQEVKNAVETLSRLVSKMETYTERVLKVESRVEGLEKRWEEWVANSEKEQNQGQYRKENWLAIIALALSIMSLLREWLPPLFRALSTN